MKEFEFEVKRRMDGDREYHPGDVRKLSATDAVHLVKSGALLPKGKEAQAAMDKLIGEAPSAQLVQEVAGSKDAGNAPINKADVSDPAAGAAADASAATSGEGQEAASSEPAQTAPAAATKAETAKPATGKRR